MDARTVGVGGLNRQVAQGGGVFAPSNAAAGAATAPRRSNRNWSSISAGAYTWCPPIDYMADGVTSSVYRCRHSHTGQFYAVKVFKDRPPAREVELLTQLKHDTIVKLIDRVEFMDGTRKLTGLVLEYCPGGCLHDYLKLPANWLGLCDSELLTLLFNISDGLDYLRSQKKVLHRDIKPGNILISYDNKGQPLFKLADFGSSRQLEDDGEFQSLVGTYEFLHPSIYEAVHRRLHQRNPQATTPAGHRPECDLWSLGVTLYQAGTGQLPFSPYEGVRKNHERMIELMVNKPVGMISATESSPNGVVNYSDCLPADANPSCELKLQLAMILKGLLAIDASEQWSFAKFFDTVRELKAKCVTYYFIAGCMFKPDFVLSDCKFDSLLRSLSDKTGYNTNDIIIYHRSQAVTAFPTGTSTSNPIIVFRMQNLKCSLSADQLDFSQLKKPLPNANANNVKEVKDYIEAAYKLGLAWHNLSRSAHLNHWLTLEAKDAALRQFAQRSQQAGRLADTRIAMCSSAQQKVGRLMELATLLRAQLGDAAFTDQVMQWQQRLTDYSTKLQLVQNQQLELGERAVEQLSQQFNDSFSEFGQPAKDGQCIAEPLMRMRLIYERYDAMFDKVKRGHNLMELIRVDFGLDRKVLADCVAEMNNIMRHCCAETLMSVCSKLDAWLRDCLQQRVEALMQLEAELRCGAEADLDMLHDLIFRGVYKVLLDHFGNRNATRDNEFLVLDKAIKKLLESTALVEDEMTRNTQLLRQLDELGLRNSGLSSLDSQASADSQ